MSLTQLHPEDLFDKESRGTLTADERARLELHVAQCSPCKLERLLRADFEAENEAPISYGDLVAGALGAVGADPADAGATPGPLAEA
ncbi:MAG TPA: zf-HC2 domain-containing protein, partial [Polyangiaceae bacterium]|nr:zf-HC2 domain-containing protein [Polyangiaceae bacterium]